MGNRSGQDAAGSWRQKALGEVGVGQGAFEELQGTGLCGGQARESWTSVCLMR